MEEPLSAFALTAWGRADCITKAFDCRSSGQCVQVKRTIPFGVASLVVRLVLIVVLSSQVVDAKCVEDITVLTFCTDLVII